MNFLKKINQYLLKNISIKARLAGFFLTVYILTISIVSPTDIGLYQILILFCYFIICLHGKSSKISFIISLAIISFATLLYLSDINNIYASRIKLLSDWAYLLLMVGALQLLTEKE